MANFVSRTGRLGRPSFKTVWRACVAATAAFAASIPLGAAWAGSAQSDWIRFADITYGGARHCGGEQATVFNTSGGFGDGNVRSRGGAGCGTDVNVPAGYLGSDAFVERADGTLCGSAPFYYNTSAAGGTGQGATNSNCSSWSSLRAYASGQFWNPNTDQYIEGSYVFSPYISH